MAEITSEEARALRLALAFGDPSAVGMPHDVLESAKAKLRAIEASAREREAAS